MLGTITKLPDLGGELADEKISSNREVGQS